MNSSAQYSALTRLLNHNTRVYQLEDLLRQLPTPVAVAAPADGWLDLDPAVHPIADLQNDIDKEVRASLVACWFAMPRELDDLEEV